MATLRVLLPAYATVLREARGALVAWLARGDRLDAVAPGRAAAVARSFAITPQSPLAAAAVTREASCGDAADAAWLRADPGFAQADMASLRLMRCGDLALSFEEAAELVRALRPLFGDDGFELSAPHADRWFLRGIASSETPDTSDPADILGDDLHAHLPTSRKWRRLLNEAQVTLHHHPVNLARVARGELPANTLWFWGAGRMPNAVAAGFQRCVAGDELIVAYAKRAHVHVLGAMSNRTEPDRTAAQGASAIATPHQPKQPTADPFENIAAEPGGALIECWTRARWDAFLAALPTLDAGLRRRRYEAIALECWTGERWRYVRRNRWRVWKPLRLDEHRR